MQSIACPNLISVSQSISKFLKWPKWCNHCLLPVAVAPSSAHDVAIRYVLPVLWMTSCLHVWPGTINAKDGCTQNDSPEGSRGLKAQRLLKLTHGGPHRVAGAESDVYDCLVSTVVNPVERLLPVTDNKHAVSHEMPWRRRAETVPICAPIPSQSSHQAVIITYKRTTFVPLDIFPLQVFTYHCGHLSRQTYAVRTAKMK